MKPRKTLRAHSSAWLEHRTFKSIGCSQRYCRIETLEDGTPTCAENVPMAKCSCATAQCVINNYWQCTTPGCANGPARPKVDPSKVARYPGDLLFKFLKQEVLAWGDHFLPPDQHVVIDEATGSPVVLLPHVDVYEVRVRRWDTIGPKSTTTWARVELEASVLQVMRPDEIGELLRYMLAHASKAINMAPPGSGLIGTFVG